MKMRMVIGLISATAFLAGGCTEEQVREFSDGYSQALQQQRSSAPTAQNTQLYDPASKTRTVIVTDESCTSDVACGYGKICVSPTQDWKVLGSCITPVTQASVPINVQQGGTIHKVSGCRFDGDCSGWNQHCVVKNSDSWGLCLQR